MWLTANRHDSLREALSITMSPKEKFNSHLAVSAHTFYAGALSWEKNMHSKSGEKYMPLGHTESLWKRVGHPV